MRGDTPVTENLAVSMDLQLTPAAAFDGVTRRAECRRGAVGDAGAGFGLPAWRHERHLISAAVLYARFILIAVTAGVTIYGVYQMLQVVRFASMTFLAGHDDFFFAVSLGWIAFAAGSVLAGASKRRDPVPSDQSPADARSPRW